MMEHGTVFLDVLTISNRLRRLDAAKVESIAASMDVLGLQQPVSIWASEDGAVVDLVAGAHRVAAAQKLGWEKIDCIFVNMDEIDRQLWEIDENLMRADLGPAELAQHTAKRADLVRQKAAIVNSQNEKKLAQRPSEGQSDFDEETANATGKSKSTVRRDKARGEAIPADVLGKIEGTHLDKGTYLDKLRKLPRDEQRAKVERDLEAGSEVGNTGADKGVREVLPGAGGQKRKKRRTSAEIHLDNFAHATRTILITCACLPTIDVPNLDSKQRSLALADLRNAVKHIQELIETVQHSHEESEPALGFGRD